MPDACGTPTRHLVAHNTQTGEDVDVLVVVGDHFVEIGDYSFDITKLRRAVGAEPPSEGAPTFHPTQDTPERVEGVRTPEDVPA